jgi:hypothetical protein
MDTTAKQIAERMKRVAKVRTYGELGDILGKITSQAISGAIAKNKIPDHWFDVIEEQYGVTKEEICQPPSRIQVISQIDMPYGDASPQEEESSFNQELDRLFTMVKRWQAEENGPDSLTSMQFVKLFHERIPELAEWIKKRKGGDNPSTVPEQLSVNDNK